MIDSDWMGRDMETFLSPVDLTSEDYASAEHRVRIEMTSFVANLCVKHR
jgi:hypothetical protein